MAAEQIRTHGAGAAVRHMLHGQLERLRKLLAHQMANRGGAAATSGTENDMNVFGAALRIAAASSGRFGSKRTFIRSIPASSAAAASSGENGKVSVSTRLPFRSRRSLTV